MLPPPKKTKDMITFKLMVRKEKMKADKTWTVYVQMIYKRKRIFLPTAMSVSKKDLTPAFKIKNAQILDRGDDLIREYKKRVNALNLEFTDWNIDALAKQLTKKSDTCLTFTAYADKWISQARIKGCKNYQSAVNALKHFLNKEDMLFSDITVNSMKAFEESLAGKARAQSLYTGCVVKIFNDARDFYNDEDNDVIRIKHSLKKYAPPRQNVAKKRALTAGDILSIMRLPYQSAPTRNGGVCRRDLAKDCFVLSFCLMGINSVDLYNAPGYDGEYITYERTKTKSRRADNAKISVRVHPYVKGLVEKYRGNGVRAFNFCKRYSSASDFNRAINIGLKEIGAELGIENLQFYAARHSMATIAVNNVRISKHIVNDMLNHVESSMKITDLYIKKDFTAINEANFRLIDYVLQSVK